MIGDIALLVFGRTVYAFGGFLAVCCSFFLLPFMGMRIIARTSPSLEIREHLYLTLDCEGEDFSYDPHDLCGLRVF